MRKEWETPKLIVLIRPEKRGVLDIIQICKGAGSYTLGPSMNAIYGIGDDAGISCFINSLPVNTSTGSCAVLGRS